MGTENGIETLAVTTSLVDSSSVSLAVIMLLLALRGGVFLVFWGHFRAKCPTFSQIKHLGLKPLLVPVFDSIGNLIFLKMVHLLVADLRPYYSRQTYYWPACTSYRSSLLPLY
ncbi:hypothetical protein TNCT_469601 [Trichonephila clavata]|uniref:Uncharacterized protein n=1 Tax=Trichonephila clavata TaxID=2740835 RepID=A0A8X6KLU5_TRICU|nr:hypothetical protein TNCT_469601 [Trichonephila clavata]